MKIISVLRAKPTILICKVLIKTDIILLVDELSIILILKNDRSSPKIQIRIIELIESTDTIPVINKMVPIK